MYSDSVVVEVITHGASSVGSLIGTDGAAPLFTPSKLKIKLVEIKIFKAVLIQIVNIDRG